MIRQACFPSQYYYFNIPIQALDIKPRKYKMLRTICYIEKNAVIFQHPKDLWDVFSKYYFRTALCYRMTMTVYLSHVRARPFNHAWWRTPWTTVNHGVKRGFIKRHVY